MDVQEVDDLLLAFPASVSHLMPKWEEIPDEFKEFRGTKWNQIFADWFYSGASDIKMYPKEGIDSAKAYRHIQAIMGSYEPPHEHKEAAVAYLMSQWFDDITYGPGGENVKV